MFVGRSCFTFSCRTWSFCVFFSHRHVSREHLLAPIPLSTTPAATTLHQLNMYKFNTFVIVLKRLAFVLRVQSLTFAAHRTRLHICNSERIEKHRKLVNRSLSATSQSETNIANDITSASHFTSQKRPLRFLL